MERRGSTRVGFFLTLIDEIVRVEGEVIRKRYKSERLLLKGEKRVYLIKIVPARTADAIERWIGGLASPAWGGVPEKDEERT